MAKIFTTSGTGAQQTLNEADNNKLKVYDSYDDIDTTELADGEIVSTKETSADGSNVYDYIDKQVEDAIETSQSYSTEEQLTGGTWIDGKPIYRKVYTITPVRLQDDSTYSFVDATLDVEQLVAGSTVGYRYNNANNKVVNALNCYVDPSDKSINVLNKGYDFYCVNIIIEYTKTTD